MKENRTSRIENFLEIFLLFVVAAVIYLTFAAHFGYYNDDWYSMYAARVDGPGAFYKLFSFDRPGRAYLMAPLYSLFGGNPLYYNFSSYLFRVLGALSLLWLLRMLWPQKRKLTILASILFLIYPGFLSEPIAIDYQSHIFGIFLGLLSLALTIKALSAPQRRYQVLWWAGAVLSGWGSLSQMEYYIGFELVRMALILMLALRENQGVRRSITSAFFKYLPYLVVPLLFLSWRLLLFHNDRNTTDVGLQLGAILTTPRHTLVSWSIYLVQDFFNVLFLAWTVPLSQLGFSENLSPILVVASVIFVVALDLLLEYSARPADRQEPDNSASFWRIEALVLGSFWIVAGLLPIILVNKHVTFFPDYSRYTLVSSAGGVLVLVGILDYISFRPARLGIIGFLFLSAMLTHLSNGLGFAQIFSDIQTFWWQVSWRIPDMEKGTTIVAHYPNGGIRENPFVWGPANQIYFVKNVNQKGDVITYISALLLDNQVVVKVLTRQPQFLDPYRSVEAYPNPRNILIITQPGPRSCVQVIDGNQPEYSSAENDSIMLIGSYSELQHVMLGAPSKKPPKALFGSEPPHDWCYFYEKASLARQQGNWDEVLRIAKMVNTRGLKPGDPIEWMPFLQAYARAGDTAGMETIAPAITSNSFVSLQACQLFDNMQGMDDGVRAMVDSRYCPKNSGQ